MTNKDEYEKLGFPLPPHDPLVCGLHRPVLEFKIGSCYCPRCIIDGDWKNDEVKPFGGAAPRPEPEKPFQKFQKRGSR